MTLKLTVIRSVCDGCLKKKIRACIPSMDMRSLSSVVILIRIYSKHWQHSAMLAQQHSNSCNTLSRLN